MVKVNGKEFKELNKLAKEIFNTFNIHTIKERLCDFKFREGIEYNNYSDNMRKYTKKELALILAEKMLLLELVK